MTCGKMMRTRENNKRDKWIENYCRYSKRHCHAHKLSRDCRLDWYFASDKKARENKYVVNNSVDYENRFLNSFLLFHGVAQHVMHIFFIKILLNWTFQLNNVTRRKTKSKKLEQQNWEFRIFCSSFSTMTYFVEQTQQKVTNVDNENWKSLFFFTLFSTCSSAVIEMKKFSTKEKRLSDQRQQSSNGTLFDVRPSKWSYLGWCRKLANRLLLVLVWVTFYCGRRSIQKLSIWSYKTHFMSFFFWKYKWQT